MKILKPILLTLLFVFFNQIVNAQNIKSNEILDDGGYGKNLLDDLSNILIYRSYPNLSDVFSETCNYLNLSNLSIKQIREQLELFDKNWIINVINFYSVNMLSTGSKSKYSFKQDLELQSVNTNDLKIYKYRIDGEMIIDSESGKIISINEIKKILL